uniref:[RNA-polymerase]-subunit kinase n=1 Tax=Brachypodium sylvaticum TaxID=29664 RepID=Q2L3D1_BRASY|nr:cyclin dependent protein kinase [Brachypodium sylvaticum]
MAAAKRSAAARDTDVTVVLHAPWMTSGKRTRLWSSSDCEETGALGEGAFGAVVEARHRATGEAVAIKKACSPTRNGGTGTGMMREAAFLAACQGHGNVVELRAVSLEPLGSSPERLSLVMGLVGPSLHDVLHHRRGGRPFPEAEVRCIMRQLLAGAQHMHGLRVVHRDIKPQNILVVAGDGDQIESVKICDLGLAVSMSEPTPYERCGTRRYMAPEVLLGKPDYDAAVDAWSLGCVMAELLAGAPLFDGEDDGAQLLSIFSVLGVPLFTLWPEYKSLPLAGKVVQPPNKRHRNKLRQHFPEERLSEEGFEVLQGLLSCNIDKRLSATTTLRRPWFTKKAVDAQA